MIGRFHWRVGNAECACGHTAGGHRQLAPTGDCGAYDECPCPLSCAEVLAETARQHGPERWPDRGVA